MHKRAFGDDLLWSTLLVEGVRETKTVGGGDELFHNILIFEALHLN